MRRLTVLSSAAAGRPNRHLTHEDLRRLIGAFDARRATMPPSSGPLNCCLPAPGAPTQPAAMRTRGPMSGDRYLEASAAALGDRREAQVRPHDMSPTCRCRSSLPETAPAPIDPSRRAARKGTALTESNAAPARGVDACFGPSDRTQASQRPTCDGLNCTDPAVSSRLTSRKTVPGRINRSCSAAQDAVR